MDAKLLLDLLFQNPRASVTDLADILNETEENVEKAKKKLEDDGIICGYHTIINWDKANVDHVDAIIGVRASTQRGTGYIRLRKRSDVFRNYPVCI